MIRSSAWLWLVLLVGTCAVAQDRTPDLAVPRPPQIWLDPGLGALTPIRLDEVAVDVRALGFVATTRIELTFYNPNDRVLEGELVFPLAAGQSVTGYALDVNGEMREGVVVAKETARVAYEEIVRRGVDPGLAELTKGNMFRTRLYPIPARGIRRVAISFDQPMLDRGNAYRYLLPMQFDQAIGRFSVHAEAIRADRAPLAVEGSAALSFDRSQDVFVADFERSNFRPGTMLAFDVPKPATAVSAFAVPDRLEPEWRTFAAQVRSSPRATTLAPPKRIALFYDASGSAESRHRGRELDFLATLLRRFGNVEVSLIAFRNDADAPVPFRVNAGDATALRRAIEALPLDGGSSYGAIRLDAGAHAELVLVVGDGLSNFGSHEPQLPPGTRVAFVHAAPTSDAARLARLARRHGGIVIDLFAEEASDALRRLEAPRWMLERARVVRGECETLAPAAPAPVATTFTLHGRCRGPAVIALAFGDGRSTVEQTVTLDDAALLDPERGAFLPRLYAVARIADLEAAERPDDGAITALAKRYGVVTRNTSMLVLETIEDYVRYEVEPREPALAQQYRAMLAQRVKDQAPDTARMHQLSRVLAHWQEFKDWHAKRHPWLETVLAETARRERDQWQAFGSLPETAKRQREAEDIASLAEHLEGRWLVDGADAARRTAWERDATTAMLALERLRRERLAIGTGADFGKRAEAQAGLGAAAVFDRAPPVPAAVPRPAVPPGAAPEAEPVELVETVTLATEAPAVERERKQEDDRNGERTVAKVKAAIELAPWNPDTPYLASIRAAKDPYRAYLDQRAQFANTPSFFLDCADYFRDERKNARLALRILSNLAEIELENVAMLRVLAYRLQQWGRYDLAVPLFEEALVLRGEEPQSRRDLALALARRPRPIVRVRSSCCGKSSNASGTDASPKCRRSRCTSSTTCSRPWTRASAPRSHRSSRPLRSTRACSSP